MSRMETQPLTQLRVKALAKLDRLRIPQSQFPLREQNEVTLRRFLRAGGAEILGLNPVPEETEHDSNDVCFVGNCKSSRRREGELVYRMRQVNGDEFLPIGCPGTIARMEEFVLAFSDPKLAWLSYIESLPLSDSLIGLQNFTLTAAFILFAHIFGAFGDCLLSDFVHIDLQSNSDPGIRYINESEQRLYNCKDEGCLAIMLQKKCNLDRRIIIRLHLTLQGDEGHANLLILDFKRKRFLVVEPNGKCASKFNQLTIERLQMMLGKDMQEDVSACFCKVKGPQSYERSHKDGGFCVSWSILFTILQLAQPEETPLSLYDQIREVLVPREMNDLVRRFNTLLELMVPEVTSYTDQELLQARVSKCFERYKGKYLSQTTLPKPKSSSKKTKREIEDSLRCSIM
jgi:hypothetical protein